MAVVFFLAYLFSIGSIRFGLAELQNRETIAKCVRLSKQIKYFLFLPLPFPSEHEVFPIHTIALTSLVHIGWIVVLTLHIFSRHFAPLAWANNLWKLALTAVLFAWVIEMLMLGSDKSSQKPPKPPKLKL